MPELPEVETVRGGLEKTMLDRTIIKTQMNRADLRIPIPADLASILDGQQVSLLQRRGKYIAVTVGQDDILLIHLGMSGRVRIYDGVNTQYIPEKHDHIIWTLSDGGVCVFQDPRRFGMVWLSKKDCWLHEAPFDRMGPEPLSNDFNGPVLRERLGRKTVPIKNALLDQRIVAGVGNIYACEALFEAGISPTRKAGDLSQSESEKLSMTIKDVLRRAIEAGGSTLKDYQKTDGSLGYFQHQFSVYDQEGQKCSDCECGGSIERIVQSGRSTFYCAAKQV